MGPPLPWNPPTAVHLTSAVRRPWVLNLSTNIEGLNTPRPIDRVFPFFFDVDAVKLRLRKGERQYRRQYPFGKERQEPIPSSMSHTRTQTQNRPERIESPPGSVSTWSRRIRWGHVIRHCRSRNIPPAGRGQKQNNSTRIETFAQVADVQHMLTTCHFPDLKASVTFHGSHHFEWCLFLFFLFFHLWKKI